MTRDEKRKRDCIKAFAKHTLSERSTDNAYLLEPGECSLIQQVEVFAGFWHTLYVGGDIMAVCFRGGPALPRHRIHWAATSNVSQYLREKAASGSGAVVAEEYDGETAFEELSEYRDECDPGTDFRRVLDQTLCGLDSEYVTQDEVDELQRRFSGRYDIYEVGMVASLAVYRAWGAIHRLNELLSSATDRGVAVSISKARIP